MTAPIEQMTPQAYELIYLFASLEIPGQAKRQQWSAAELISVLEKKRQEVLSQNPNTTAGYIPVPIKRMLDQTLPVLLRKLIFEEHSKDADGIIKYQPSKFGRDIFEYCFRPFPTLHPFRSDFPQVWKKELVIKAVRHFETNSKPVSVIQIQDLIKLTEHSVREGLKEAAAEGFIFSVGRGAFRINKRQPLVPCTAKEIDVSNLEIDEQAVKNRDQWPKDKLTVSPDGKSQPQPGNLTTTLIPVNSKTSSDLPPGHKSPKKKGAKMTKPKTPFSKRTDDTKGIDVSDFQAKPEPVAPALEPKQDPEVRSAIITHTVELDTVRVGLLKNIAHDLGISLDACLVKICSKAINEAANNAIEKFITDWDRTRKAKVAAINKAAAEEVFKSL